jgi:hypothetical protein
VDDETKGNVWEGGGGDIREKYRGEKDEALTNYLNIKHSKKHNFICVTSLFQSKTRKTPLNSHTYFEYVPIYIFP